MRRAAILVATAWLLVPPAADAGARAGAVATEHQLAAAAGAELLDAGGSVVDAAIAAAAAVCVVHPSSCGIGGGGFALVRLADGTSAALDFRECAPAGATPERFRPGGTPDPSLTRRGGLAVAVPGEVAGWVTLHARFGRLPLRRVLAPAARLARDGFPLAASPHLQREIERNRDLLAADPGLQALFLPPAGGERTVIVQSDLARTLDAVGREGAPAFYGGATARAIATTVQAHGGVLTTKDLAAYRPVWRTPLSATRRGRRILGFPPPGSGGVVLEVLGLLDRDDLAALGAGSVPLLHLVAEAMAQGFADRARWYGDPAFTTVPIPALLAPRRLEALRARIVPDRVTAPDAALVPDAGTANVSVVDAAGNAAVITTTINMGFGAGILVPGTGIILNNEMDDFAIAPEVPNVYGLVGAAANAIAPGKRPQSSMSPTIVLRGKRPELAVGGSGGPMIISGVIQVVLGVTALGRDLPDAVAAPRIHDQGPPTPLLVEPAVNAEVRAGLERIGHTVKEFPSIGAVSAAGLDARGQPVAAGDRRKDGSEPTVLRRRR